METVTKVINAQEEVSLLASHFHLVQGQDFNIFIDSTCIRFSFKDINDDKVKRFTLALQDNKLFTENGCFLDEDICFKENLPAMKDMADLIWWASKGIQIAPDFFHDSHQGKAGMHGYLSIDNISNGFLICDSATEEISHYSVCRCSDLSDILF